MVDTKMNWFLLPKTDKKRLWRLQASGCLCVMGSESGKGISASLRRS